MKSRENNIKVSKTARYYTSDPMGKIGSLWVVIHGYAQLAGAFIKDFDFLSGDDSLIVAPEGLSKFYFRDKIGASWMTKEDRINEINDYNNYLDKLFSAIKNNYDISEAGINVLGFSQGVHTAVRWFIHTENKIDNLLLCSSDFPKDADFIKLKEKLLTSKMYFIYGNTDEVIGKKTFEESKSLLQNNNINFEERIFNGGHRIDKESLANI